MDLVILIYIYYLYFVFVVVLNSGNDVLAKAKTGTGKTLSFLLPAIEGISRTPRPQRRGISALIISPTRELAQQIADEANQVLVSENRRR